MSAAPALVFPLRSVPAVAAATIVLVGCIVLFGWALAVLLAGIALWRWRTGAAGLRARRLARACGLGVALVGCLTAPEQEVLRLITNGRTNRAIAQMLGCPVGTVKDYVQKVIRKLEVSDRTQAAVKAVRLGLVEAAGHGGKR